MSGRFVRLEPGRYTLAVSAGEGPAGVHRCEGEEVRVDVHGGRVDFVVADHEEAYYWWRGPGERAGVRLFGISDGGSGTDRALPLPRVTTG
ncbi:MAG TPA: hypothetical protein VK966_05980 [Longimicrobiales bacterium]|nr:hypothetical protein [Longimicrobiales bacterium]